MLKSIGKVVSGFRLYTDSVYIPYVAALLFLPSGFALPLPDPPVPLCTLYNENATYSLINSIHFHPHENLFCAAYSQNNRVYFYRIEEDSTCSLVQVLSNPEAKLMSPQHAVFSSDGNRLLVVNWKDGSFNSYFRGDSGLFSETPAISIACPKDLSGLKPHGMAFSHAGKHLALAYGASSHYKGAIALFRWEEDSLALVSLLTKKMLTGTPKGICFSPDDTHLIVSSCDPDSIKIFCIENEKIRPHPTQTLSGPESELSRPEDVKISPDGSCCVATNSSCDTVCFFLFDASKNAFPGRAPFFTLRNPEAALSFPHGIDFSFDGQYLGITQFGSVHTIPSGDVVWPPSFLPHEGTIQILK